MIISDADVEQVEMSLEVMTCLLEAVADDGENISKDKFDRICKSIVKAVWNAGKLDEKFVDVVSQAFKQVMSLFLLAKCIVMIFLRHKKHLKVHF